MTPLAGSGVATHSSSTDTPWGTLSSGQAMPVMSLSVPAFLLGLHALQGVLGNFQLPAFIQTLSKERPNGQGDRLFTLPPNVINVDDFKRFTPRKRHLKPKKLLKRLGDDFDPFWMSVDIPDDLLETHVKHALDVSLDWQLKDINLTALETTLKLKFGGGGTGEEESSANSHMPSDILNTVRSWLVKSASCPVYHRWEDQGLLYWPRWVRRGMCSLNDTPMIKLTSKSGSKIPFSSCSWPPGMHCVPEEGKRLTILRWQCRHNKALNNFNRFQLPGMSPPRKQASKSQKGPAKSQPHASKKNPKPNLIKHKLEGQNRTNHHSQHPKRRASPEDKQSRDRREASSASLGGKTNDPSKPLGDYSVRIGDIDKHISSFQEKWKGITGVPEGFPYSVREGGPPATQQSVDNSKHRGGAAGKNIETDGNHTENWNGTRWKQRRRTLDLKCKWIKVFYSVTDSCFCSC